ncbi:MULTISPECIES: hypothetical protein [Lactobacillus]|jgi:hypothetical protein|uniref:hypothetical protein n=1 Tax=Lactobacillus TaxID=1578 RepID=UPI00119277BA|nr:MULTISPECIES: hypothetical protein [Lactobacillus]MCF1851231.1 hypothetical protein [Lactobacillus jensenii]MCZ3724183.1 hypothetical protein [Lactobacillus jensenii]MCZ3725706.1 hypothetical protein [Lactobacillus jensenii]MCZ3727146.1 hypothetical protein [Lactobacillus jensenii]MCZ3728708.1 hypothetical protein [Lactobacillus jensenii]
MIEVLFLAYPRSGKAIFKTGGLFKKAKPVSIAEANEKIKAFAQKLSKHQSEAIKFDVIENESRNEGNTRFSFDTEIKAEDDGILDLIARDSENDELDDETYEILEDLKGKIQNEILDDDEEDSEELSLVTDAKAKPAEAVEYQEKPTEAQENEATITADNSYSPATSNYSNAALADSNVNIASQPSQSYPIQSYEPVSETTTVLNPNSSPEVTETPPVKGEELISSADFETTEDIFSRIADKYDVNQFAIEQIKTDLGYKKTPQDKLDEELNSKIDEIINNYGLNSVQAEYANDIAKFENQTIDTLAKKYDELNNETIASAVEKNVAEKIKQLKQETEEKKAKLDKDTEQLIANKKDDLSNIFTQKVTEYEARISEQNEHELTSFSSKVNQELNDNKAKADQALENEMDKAKADAKDEIIRARNRDMKDCKGKIAADFIQNVHDSYQTKNRAFTSILNEVIKDVEKSKKKIVQKHEEGRRKDKELELRELELKQKEKELALAEKKQSDLTNLPDQIAKAISNANNQVTPTSTIQLPNYVTPAVQSQPYSVENKQLEEILKQNAELQAQLNKAINEINTFKLQNEVNGLKKELATTKKRSKFLGLGLVTFLCVAFFSAISLKDNFSKVSSSTAQQPKIEINMPKTKSSSKAKIQKVDALSDYKNSKSWADKVNILNSLLGQKDIKSLQTINLEDPTNLSALYLAITKGDQDAIRSTYQKMSSYEKQFISDSAKNSLVLAFQANKDWANAWRVQNDNK